MKVIRSVRLWQKEGASENIYEVALVDLETEGRESRFLVNFRYGKAGKALREGTKTVSPVTLSRAQRTFDSVVVAKLNDGYRRGPPLELVAEAARSPSTISGSASRSRPAGPAPTSREAALLAQLTDCIATDGPEAQRDRLLWRLGVVRLTAAAPQLTEFTRTLGARLASYSLVYALARCNGAEALSLLQEIADNNILHATRDYAAYALASELMGAQRLPPRLPLPQPHNVGHANRIVAAVTACDGAELLQVLLDEAQGQPGFANAFLIALAHRALADPASRAALLAALRAVTVRPPFVQVLRRLFKYADLTDDGRLFAETARQFELADPMYRSVNVYNGRIWLDGLRKPLIVKDEHASANPRIALSDNTLLYFRRRAWRMLRKRAELEQDAFTAMAGELLLAFTEGDGGKSLHGNRYVKSGDSYELERYWNGPFANVWSLSHVLYAAAPGSKFNSWNLSHSHVGDAQAAERSEAFPALWDRAPRLLLRIAVEARNRPAAVFAVTALARGPERDEELEKEAFAGLVASPYEEVVAFAATIARRLVEAGRADASVVAVLLGAADPELWALAIAAIDHRSDWPWSDARLALAVMTSPIEAIREAMRRWITERAATKDQLSELAQGFVAWLGQLPAEPDSRARDRLRVAMSHLPLLWPENDCPLEPERIEELMGHGSSDVQAAAVSLLAVTELRPDQLPESLWQVVLTTPVAEIRAAGMRLLGRLDTPALVVHHDSILAAALSEHADLRLAARPLAVRLGREDTGFAALLRDHLMTVLFHAEPAEGHGADMASLFAESLPEVFASLDRGTLWRLLQAKAKGARLLGVRALETAAAGELSVRQIARLGNHPYAAARRFAIQRLETEEQRFRAEPEEAVLLVESAWDDVRDAAIARFTAWPVEALPAAALAVMADSTVPAVQDGARQLLRRRLGNDDAGIVLERLLEHPAGSFHLFVTELITAGTLSDPTMFEKFLVQARIILMQINRGRVAKDRVLAVLRREALAREDRAGAIWGLVHDLTLSAVSRDKAPALIILRDIAQKWPAIALPLSVTPVASRQMPSRETAA